ncbi:DUF5627 domain-containing protein [Prolixibacter sp. NT017]|uniref:DUF5627 domain-containing protein n=1 Tax=Prolixibacter sp. NT017 TaxID=2652390 RepID=UPI0012993697|nr:DUF5627 domain-containing protein [Prolixibacter sp. NT017]
MKRIFYILLIALPFLMSACHNQDWSFPDYKYTTVYFPYQAPVRTLVLGKDIYDNTLDNAHKCKIMATMGGVYNNNVDRILHIEVDNSLCDNLKFDDASGDDVIAMPSNYYTLSSDKQLVIPADSIVGGIEVQLTDAFFADPRSIKNTFVIPVRITSVENADSILSGKSSMDNPDPRVAADWTIVPKNYILYGVKYVNPWNGSYLRRGVDDVKGNGGNSSLDTTIVYHQEYTVDDEVVTAKTLSMDEVSIVLKTVNKGDATEMPFELRIKVDDSGKCTVSNPDSAGYTITGSGDFVENGDSWGGEKHDVMHLKYNVDFGTTTHSFTDTLVIRDRNVKMETFTPYVVGN